MAVTFWIGLVLVIFFGIDIIGFFIFGLSRLPTSFTEWWCFPFYISILNPFVKDGFGMRIASFLRIAEFIGLVVGVVLMMIR